ncbi:hypothetical protein BY458DRAFT_501871 [Sporodiniella umbellata]|nr:hypothetical protein BY458DRAFT_501871 [Sporodiniella umbellata]
MRYLFDTRKEHKSLKLVKKLQEEADKEWQKELVQRKEQESRDEKIAKELQAQLEREQTETNPFYSSSYSPIPSPPPLPVKPHAYHQEASNSTISIAPLYGLHEDSNASLAHRKSYIPYKPNLTNRISSPSPTINNIPSNTNLSQHSSSPAPSNSSHNLHNPPKRPILHKEQRTSPKQQVSFSNQNHSLTAETSLEHPRQYPKSPYCTNNRTPSPPLVMSMPEPMEIQAKTTAPVHLSTRTSMFYSSLEPKTPINLHHPTHGPPATHSYNAPTFSSVSLPPQKLDLPVTNPYKTSDSFFSLKPNQEKTEDIRPVHLETHTSVRSQDSGYDYSDMVYVKGSQMMANENPFADSHAIPDTVGWDPKGEEKTENVYMEKEAVEEVEEKVRRTYMEKEQVQQEMPEEEVTQVFPTQILRASAPNYGYYPSDRKEMPKLPVPVNKEDRHITVASLTPGRRVWIRIHPGDTGKMLAERIHIVATFG